MINRPDICRNNPVPRPIHREKDKLVEEVAFYGREYHGKMDHKSAEQLLEGTEAGSYLIRRSPGSTLVHYTLSVRFNGLTTKHFKLFYQPDVGHYLRDNYKKFETVEDLVEDGLMNYQLEQIHGKGKISQATASPENTLPKATNPLLERQESHQTDDDEEKREHVFKIQTFRGLNWCEVCAQFLWGFSVQGVKCEHCSFVAHKKCSESVAKWGCTPNRNEKGPLFGVELSLITKSHCNSIPFIVVKCVEEIEARGIYQEGIYRVSAFADEVEELKASFEKNGRQTNISGENLSIHTVAGVLKSYFRQLPTPLITADCSALLMASIESNDDPGKQLKAVKMNLLTLPTCHFNCIKYIANHLRRVSTYHEQNKMNENNLATVFAPTLIGTDFMNHFTDLAREIILLHLIIKHCSILFS